MKKLILFCTFALCLLTGCNLTKAVSLAKCNYSYSSVSDITFLDMTPSQLLSVGGGIKVAQAFLGKSDKAPLGMIIHLKVTNPNQKEAALEGLYYTVKLDSVEIGEGTSLEPISVAPESVIDLPLKFSVDLKTALKSDKRGEVVKVVKKLTGLSKDTTHVTVNLKPTMKMGKNGTFTYPNYIPIKFDL